MDAIHKNPNTAPPLGPVQPDLPGNTISLSLSASLSSLLGKAVGGKVGD